MYKAFKESQQTGEQNANNSSSSAHSSASQQKILQFPHISNPLPRFSIRHQELFYAVTEFVCQDMQPVSAVEGIGFCKPMHSLKPRFQVPSRNYLSRKEIPCRYNQEVKHLKSQLLNPTSFSVTTDVWVTAHQNRSYLSLTCHFDLSLFPSAQRQLKFQGAMVLNPQQK